MCIRTNSIRRLIIASITIVLTSHFSYGNEPDTLQVWNRYVEEGPVDRNLPDFSYAGQDNSFRCTPERHVTVTDDKYGAIPDDNIDDRDAIQKAIDDIGSRGGGIIYFPEGRYNIRGGRPGDILQLKMDNIVLRGAGKDSKGVQKSILYLEKGSTEGRLAQPGTIDNDIRQNALIQIIGGKSDKTLSVITGDALRGETIIPVSGTSLLTEGQIIKIELTDPVDLENPDIEDTDLIQKLIEPRELKENEIHCYAEPYAKTIYWVTRIKRIIDQNSIELYNPLRVDHLERHKPRIVEFKGLTGIGVEDLALESAWPGQYVHHRPHPYWAKDDQYIIRGEREQDYEWIGVWVSLAADCWIKNTDIRGFTQGMIFTHCSYITSENICFWGTEGHAGVTLSMASNLLFKQLHYYARFIHPISLRAWSNGNVFTSSTAHYDGRDPVSGGGPMLDFHGIFPYENLFDNLKGFYVASGGLRSVHPNAGVRNVFWNISTPPRIDRYLEINNEFLNASFADKDEMYKEHPQSFLIGIHSPGQLEVKIAGESNDRCTQWFTVEAFNKPLVNMPSLYIAQVELHRSYD